jgi:hypothetical protein
MTRNTPIEMENVYALAAVLAAATVASAAVPAMMTFVMKEREYFNWAVQSDEPFYCKGFLKTRVSRGLDLEIYTACMDGM